MVIRLDHWKRGVGWGREKEKKIAPGKKIGNKLVKNRSKNAICAREKNVIHHMQG